MKKRFGAFPAATLLAVAGMPWLSEVALAERVLARYEGLTAVIGDNHTCGANVPITVRAGDKRDFEGQRLDLQKLVGGLAAALGFECPGVSTMSITGMVDGTTRFNGTAAASEGWRLRPANVQQAGQAWEASSKLFQNKLATIDAPPLTSNHHSDQTKYAYKNNINSPPNPLGIPYDMRVENLVTDHNNSMHAALLWALGREPNYTSYWNNTKSHLDGTVTIDGEYRNSSGEECQNYSRRTFHENNIVEFTVGSACGGGNSWTFNEEHPQDTKIVSDTYKKPFNYCADLVRKYGRSDLSVDCDRRKIMYWIAENSKTNTLTSYLEQKENNKRVKTVIVLYENEGENFGIIVPDLENYCGKELLANAHTNYFHRTPGGNLLTGQLVGDMLHERNLRRTVNEATKNVTEVCPTARRLVVQGWEESEVVVKVISDQVSSNQWQISALEYEEGKGIRSGGYGSLMTAIQNQDLLRLDESGVTYQSTNNERDDRFVLCNTNNYETRVATIVPYCEITAIMEGHKEICIWQARGWSYFDAGQCKAVRTGTITRLYVSIQKQIGGKWLPIIFGDDSENSSKGTKTEFSLEHGCGTQDDNFSIDTQDPLDPTCGTKPVRYAGAFYNLIVNVGPNTDYTLDY